ncbi:hypothetical protein AUEXF2481DRAFT_34848 [Aureobasidium subglaciale EXF-2481]|uniref:Uncharacterized protein n=1 Tax=Aureobasidium subglaciale (strain EXF-2481) TaxID=1043005 RepID=A0A074YSC2_AURSE|nr:uncharacterized protein AUEXF2481DRAFT_34848 [Aureobasidium subglaciale EXF-2481]KER00619.1 hypothetical protein AUEXF2481DRAFT_34848 [Aureobasidium subglaciale EXF-2481]
MIVASGKAVYLGSFYYVLFCSALPFRVISLDWMNVASILVGEAVISMAMFRSAIVWQCTELDVVNGKSHARRCHFQSPHQSCIRFADS